MATSFAARAHPCTSYFLQSSSRRFTCYLWSGGFRSEKFNSNTCRKLGKWNQRRPLICAVKEDDEDSFKHAVEMDRLIDMLRTANDKEIRKLVAENVFVFNENFWMRIAARADACKSEDDKKDLEELASILMDTVDSLVHKTHEKIESDTDVLKAILRSVVHEEEDVFWPPRDPEALSLLEKELNQREQEGQLDEGFLSEVYAQLRKVKDGDKPGLQAMLQKVLQFYASRVLSKRSYARKGRECGAKS
ncbi:unnamed protein product [Cuscuta europaea]|uniref:Uncharacterized protein n=1 Tax=Cuscuta europaea TaxID=41803 RepID=A0A9P0ZHM7_CUSEU|nr:unnamed protein product [Cuscuta europaea]